jgi:hypothetical protein
MISDVSSAPTRWQWLELAQTRVVRSLAIVQSVVIITTAACLLAFTSMSWFVALLAGVTLSVLLNLGLSRFSRAALSKERGRRRA